jgi:hypothetical protein
MSLGMEVSTAHAYEDNVPQRLERHEMKGCAKLANRALVVT